MDVNVSQKIARFILDSQFKNIPEVACNHAKMGMLDWLSVVMVGLKEEQNAIKKIKDLFLDLDGQPRATIIGTKLKISSPLAAKINAFSGHILDYDDTCTLIRSHLSAPLMPSILAVGEENKISGEELLLSYMLGYEVSLRIGQVMTPMWIERGWHGTSIFGVFGVTAAVGKILKLNIEQMQNALGIAASTASGLANNFGTMTKPLHVGLAAYNGILAVIMAKQGLTASKDAIEGTNGFFHAYGYGVSFSLDHIERLGSPWGLEKPGVLNPKLYPCCHGVATNIEQGIRLRQKYRLSVDEIQDIEIHTQSKALSAMLSKSYTKNGERVKWGYNGPPLQVAPSIPLVGNEGKFSKEYAFARALLDGEVSFEHFTDEAVNDPLIKQLMGKIKVYHNGKLESISFEHPEEECAYGEIAIVRLKNGYTVEDEQIYMQGATKRPLSMDDVRKKFIYCANESGLAQIKKDKIITTVKNIENAGSISDLFPNFEGLLR